MKCQRCNAHTETADGSKVGGMPGITYHYCRNCGWSRAITRKPAKRDALRQLKKGAG